MSSAVGLVLRREARPEKTFTVDVMSFTDAGQATGRKQVWATETC